MKYIKKILIVTIIILLSGCSVKYNLKINNDSSVNEEVIVSESINTMKSKTGLDVEESVKYLYDMFKRDNKNDDFSYDIKGNIVTGTVTSSYDDIDEYASNFTSDVVKEANITKSGDEVTLTLNQSEALKESGTKVLVYDNIIINIEVPFTVVKSNADSVSGNTYTWNIKKDNSLKEISITYKDKDYNDGFKFSIGDKVFNINYLYIVLFGFVFIIVIIVLFVYFNNKKNNKV